MIKSDTKSFVDSPFETGCLSFKNYISILKDVTLSLISAVTLKDHCLGFRGIQQRGDGLQTNEHPFAHPSVFKHIREQQLLKTRNSKEKQKIK